MMHFETNVPRRATPTKANPTSESGDPGRGGRLMCAHCNAPITTDDQRIEVSGRHEHYFVNPHGFDFHVGCFGEAPGATSAGRASSEFTWFPGHTWQMALCSACTTHLGWLFRSPRAVFHGLILDRLIRVDDH
jgi:hypothetical protein